MKEDQTINDIWSILLEAANSRSHAYHVLSLAYQSQQVECCSVVLQGIESATVRFHAHHGSPKIAAIIKNPRVSLLGYDRLEKEQIRIKGTVVMHHGDEEAKRIWHTMKDSSKLCYQYPAPGIDRDGEPLSQERLRENLKADPLVGLDAFVVCYVQIDMIDLLRLQYKGHQRFQYINQGGWLVKEVQA
ncbi:pyridoxamine 5'-phosphate oxidase family protein [Candidatus Synchoanobacter obligatus]|uniref:Pyridoxamine 5'-phosphate oxidase family protein n=1 Tax=Candidatus Synchoanobacter obligatus TaxID=2919597 RepID=A0ABT1L4G7_9GAMM|nr:pyridoxamine 5'-phosphate oxidase family protein [Candidatus Synchoanobacter obligatus]MCP8352072.1 pyridoxamine 5'-phosphate oxidase family protein [Candidatus Synchoanobacter obligatus]